MKEFLTILLLLPVLSSPIAALAQSRWLTSLNDTLPLAALSIPGAHDAATSSLRGWGRCQALSIPELLQAGVRAFDLRPTQNRRLTRKGFRFEGLGNIHHGMKDTGISLDEAFACFNAFLEANPGEMLIVIVRDESAGRFLTKKPDAPTFTAALSTFLKSQKRIVPFRAKLRLGDARGGIIVLCRTGSPENMASTYVTWNHSINGSRDRRIHHAPDAAVPLAVQDCYSPSAAGGCDNADFLARKLRVAEDFLDAAAHADGKMWFVNHASAYVGKFNYCRHAEWMNLRLSDYIRHTAMHAEKGHFKPEGATGILLMDFAGVDEAKFRGRTYATHGESLLRAVIENNFRHMQTPQTSPMP